MTDLNIRDDYQMTNAENFIASVVADRIEGTGRRPRCKVIMEDDLARILVFRHTKAGKLCKRPSAVCGVSLLIVAEELAKMVKAEEAKGK